MNANQLCQQQKFTCEQCGMTVSASQIVIVRHGALVIFNCQCNRTTIIATSPDTKTLIMEKHAEFASGLIVFLNAEPPKIFLPQTGMLPPLPPRKA